jgi:hypothetical protein
MAPNCVLRTIAGRVNQPRLKATSTNENTNSVKFEMIDITNLAKPEAGHVKDLELRLTAPNQLTILFTFVASHFWLDCQSLFASAASRSDCSGSCGSKRQRSRGRARTNHLLPFFVSAGFVERFL